jgi:hypothetical protein
MIVMTTGMTSLMVLMRQDERPVERPATPQPSSQRPITTTSCRSRPSRS